MAVQKRKRTHKVSKGINGARKHRLSEVEKVNARKGMELESFGAPHDSYRKWYERLQRLVDAKWEREQREKGKAA